ncbi:hypothetical protein ASF44_13975 [Pseudorhodoferax sp. Leaf274]|nr:hypothetical protein ASF44_13975 [Pseudorhodoferax sp. Leaf274]
MSCRKGQPPWTDAIDGTSAVSASAPNPTRTSSHASLASSAQASACHRLRRNPRQGWCRRRSSRRPTSAYSVRMSPKYTNTPCTMPSPSRRRLRTRPRCKASGRPRRRAASHSDIPNTKDSIATPLPCSSAPTRPWVTALQALSDGMRTPSIGPHGATA